MAIVGAPKNFFLKAQFRVEIDGFDSAAFQKCSALEVEVGKVEYYEGGAMIPHKAPGRLTYSDVTLERGATIDLDIYRWFRDVAQASAGVGLAAPLFKRNLDIVQLDRDGSTLQRWTLVGAFPVKFVAGEWDNDADEVVIEQLTLAYDYFELRM